MRSFEKLLAELKKLNLPRDEFAVFGSGPLAIKGIRDSEDLDIIAKPNLWKWLIRKYPREKDNLIKIGKIEIFSTWTPWFENINLLIDDAEILEEIRFVKLKYVLAGKRLLEEKRTKDILLIEDYLKKNKTRKQKESLS